MTLTIALGLPAVGPWPGGCQFGRTCNRTWTIAASGDHLRGACGGWYWPRTTLASRWWRRWWRKHTVPDCRQSGQCRSSGSGRGTGAEVGRTRVPNRRPAPVVEGEPAPRNLPPLRWMTCWAMWSKPRRWPKRCGSRRGNGAGTPPRSGRGTRCRAAEPGAPLPTWRLESPRGSEPHPAAAAAAVTGRGMEAQHGRPAGRDHGGSCAKRKCGQERHRRTAALKAGGATATKSIQTSQEAQAKLPDRPANRELRFEQGERCAGMAYYRKAKAAVGCRTERPEAMGAARDAEKFGHRRHAGGPDRKRIERASQRKAERRCAAHSPIERGDVQEREPRTLTNC